LNDKEKSKKQLMAELTETHYQIAALEKSVSKLKDRLRKLEKSESMYRTVADNTFDWEFWLGPGADFIYSSPSVLRITGYEPDEFLSDSGLFLRIVHKDDLTRVAENLNRRRIEKGFCELEFRIISRTGEEKWIAMAFHGVYDDSGNYLGIRGSSREFTALKKMEGDQVPEIKSAKP